MNSLKNNASIFVLDMCTKQIEHYTKVIDSCETLEQLNAASGWILCGFKKLRSVVENLPRRRQKLCLSVFDAAKYYVFSVSQSKGLDLFRKEIEGVDPECSESEIGEKIGSALEGLAGAFPGTVCGKIVIKRKKAAEKDPVDEQPSGAEKPESERPEASDPDPSSPAESPSGSETVS